MLKGNYCHEFSQCLLHTHTHTHTHTYIYIHTHTYTHNFFISPSPTLCLHFFILYFSFYATPFPLLVLFKYFSSVFSIKRANRFCTTMVHYMYHLALFVVPFNIPKPTQCSRQISSKRFTNTVLELLIFMQRKANVSVVMSPCTSVRPYRTRLPLDDIFTKLNIWKFFYHSSFINI